MHIKLFAELSFVKQNSRILIGTDGFPRFASLQNFAPNLFQMGVHELGSVCDSPAWTPYATESGKDYLLGLDYF